MTNPRRSVLETADWPTARPRSAALVSPQVMARAVRRLEDALSVLDLTGRVSARARGVVRVGSLERAD
jgi:hypothetical protein